MTGTEEADRQREVSAVLLKIVGVAVAIGLVIGIGAWVMVKAIGLDAPDDAVLGTNQVEPVAPLPSTALPVPSESPLPGDDASGVVTEPPAPGSEELYLTASPVFVKPGERINLTGRWPGHDNESILVQRFEDGRWEDFGVQARVNVGTYGTYVLTNRTGDQRFRMYDPNTETASNEVTVTIE